MQQFDVLMNPHPGTSGAAPFVVILQHDHITIDSVLIAPLFSKPTFALIERLHIAVNIGGDAYIVSLTDLVSIQRRRLSGPVLGNLSEWRDDLQRGYDLLYVGF